MASQAPRVIVIGAGIIGCSTAYYLAHEGATVTLVDRDADPSPTSRAALGVLAHAYGGNDALSCFYRDAHALHESLAARLRSETGIDVGWQALGSLDLAFDDDDACRLRQLITFNRDRGAEAHWLDPTLLRACEPELSPAAIGAVLFPQDARVDPVRLAAALGAAASALGTKRRISSVVTSLTRAGAGVDCTVTDSTGERVERYDAAVITTGPWVGELAPGVRLRPVRGQSGRFIGVRTRHVVRWGRRQAVNDGMQMLIGATVEEVGFDLSTTAAAASELMAWGERVFIRPPSLVEMRAGLRPKPRCGRPVIAAVEGSGPLFVATGHYKSGVLMGPLTGKVVARWIIDGSPGRDMSPFTVER
ncbi:MAG: FAD-dependent oxidoreductase [bacterium]|nr:FAD-dependent oxidoreductase [bacterium]